MAFLFGFAVPGAAAGVGAAAGAGAAVVEFQSSSFRSASSLSPSNGSREERTWIWLFAIVGSSAHSPRNLLTLRNGPGTCLQENQGVTSSSRWESRRESNWLDAMAPWISRELSGWDPCRSLDCWRLGPSSPHVASNRARRKLKFCRRCEASGRDSPNWPWCGMESNSVSR